MKYSDWKLLTNEEKQQVKLKHRPHIRVATLFSVLFFLLLIAFVFRVLKNRTIHVIRKPTPDEAYFIAKAFVKDQLKIPSASSFSSKKHLEADTAKNLYHIIANVNTQDLKGRQVKLKWSILLNYVGGDWEDKHSWLVKNIEFTPAK